MVGAALQQEQETLQALQSQLADLQKVKAACAANAPNKDALFDVEVNGTSRSFAALQVLNRKTLHFLFSCGGAKAPPPTPAGNPYGAMRGEQRRRPPRPAPWSTCSGSRRRGGRFSACQPTSGAAEVVARRAGAANKLNSCLRSQEVGGGPLQPPPALPPFKVGHD